ncbi:SUMF1/EgtB/PvdO family nonheme iron enzyme [Anaerolineales bacterium HSG25]|nr:SUMF1/EgtB/PvdO family nonheme iron enzyme [Anaerolineales bacterium HSG25]
MTKKLIILLQLTLIIPMLACGGNGNETTDQAAAPVVQITIKEDDNPLLEVVDVEVVPQDNCGGSAEVENGLERSRTIEHTMTVGGGIELTADGGIKPGGVGVNLGASVAANYDVGYGQADEIGRSITVKAKEGTRMEHTIQLVEQFETGEAIVIIDGSTYKVPFVFRTDFAVILQGSQDLGCKPTATPDPNQPEPTATNTPMPAPTWTPTNTPAPADTWTPTPIPSINTPIPPQSSSDMVHVPAGEFSMGSDRYDDEKPIHTVYLDEYYIDTYEVTNAQFAQFLNDKGNQTEEGTTWLDIGDSDSLIEQSGGSFQAKAGFANHPVIEVTWFGAKAYCEAQGKRLPTEAEWEKAARGTDGRIYPWGEGIDSGKANYNQNVGQTTEVGSYSSGVSPYGAHDMAGNVWEWVQDCYDESYYSSSPSRNPINNSCSNSEKKVLRGGSWYNLDSSVRAANRVRRDPANTSYLDGFRCLRSP